MAFKGRNYQYNSENDETIGSFAGYVRRAKTTSQHGVVASFFGENGEDADCIAALNLSQFQDVEVLINVYMIKDSNGRDMRSQETNTYPIISTFISRIQRPIPSQNGLTAQFFASNGADADSIVELGKSMYQDALVYVDLRGKLANKNVYEYENQEAIIESHAHKLSQSEMKAYKLKEKKFLKLNQALLSGNFYGDESVLKVINELYPYEEFLKEEVKCVYKQFNNMAQTNNIDACGCEAENKYHTNNDDKDKYNYVLLCDKHNDVILDLVEKDNSNDNLMILYLQQKNIALKKAWAITYFRNEFSLTGKEEPDSYKMLCWAKENKLGSKLPETFAKKAMDLENNV